MPTCWIIAGPNGAGKTTFALDYLPTVANCRRFVNADLIAAGLSPLAPDSHLQTASRLFLAEIEQCIADRADFAFETTLAGRGYLKLMRRLQSQGWRVELIYLALPSAEMSRLRVAERVRHGGHGIPAKDIIRRFPRSLHNMLQLFSPLADQTRCFMNHGDVPELVFRQQAGQREIFHAGFFEFLQQEALIMSSPIFPTPDRDTQAMLDSLRQTAAKTLDRKRRLGQYAVIWRNNAPVLLGEDAPLESSAWQQQDEGW